MIQREMQEQQEILLQDLQNKQQELFNILEQNKTLKEQLYESDDHIKQLQAKLNSVHDRKKLQEQRDLLIDLRQKVQMYEREL